VQEDAVRAEYGDGPAPSFAAPGGHGVPEQQPGDSVYYHPTLNPSGTPPPGKPQRYKTTAMLEAAQSAGERGAQGLFIRRAALLPVLPLQFRKAKVAAIVLSDDAAWFKQPLRPALNACQRCRWASQR